MAEHVFAALVEQGIVEDKGNVRRVVIDLQRGNVAVLHVEYICEVPLLDVVQRLDGIVVKGSADARNFDHDSGL